MQMTHNYNVITSPIMIFPTLSRQSGNVLFLILIAVILFAALSYAVTFSTRSGTGNAASEKSKLLASQIVQYLSEVETAIMRLRLANGCTENEISFENPIVSGYANSSAPVDKRCNVFDPAGGGVSWQDPPLAALDSTYSAMANYGHYYFTSSSCVPYLGHGVDDCHLTAEDYDLMGTLMYLKLNVCQEINRRLRGSPDPVHDENAIWRYAAKFDGTYTTTMVRVDPARPSDLSLCVDPDNAAEQQPANSYHFFHVLIAR